MNFSCACFIVHVGAKITKRPIDHAIGQRLLTIYFACDITDFTCQFIDCGSAVFYGIDLGLFGRLSHQVPFGNVGHGALYGACIFSRTVKVCCYQGWMRPQPKVANSAPPKGVDYDAWLGP